MNIFFRRTKNFILYCLSIALLLLHSDFLFAQAEKELLYECKDENVLVRIVLTPDKISLTDDTMLSFEIFSPSNTIIKMPELEDRLQGFYLSGNYPEQPLFSTEHKKLVQKFYYKLTPIVSEEYRIAPMAIRYEIAQKSLITINWIQTPPIKMQLAPLPMQTTSKSIRDILPAFKIYPSKRIVLNWLLSCIAAIAVLAFIIWLIRYVNFRIKLARMSPKERALYELKKLINENLIAKGKIKDFYLELTMIVRRYIERAHKIKAPELTTEEFLQAATKNPRFSKTVIEKLKHFLEISDLVKFAAYRPEQRIIDDSLRTAEDYIRTDEATHLNNKEGFQDA